MCAVWNVFCSCAQYTFLMYRLKVFCCSAQDTLLMCRLESVLLQCTVHISDVPSAKFCFCAEYTFLMYRLECVLCTVSISDNPSGKWFLCTVHIFDIPFGKRSVHSTHFYVPPGKCFVSVHRKHLCFTVWKVLFMCTVYISDYRLEIFASVHSTHFLYTVWKAFCFCAHYTFLLYGLGSVVHVHNKHF